MSSNLIARKGLRVRIPHPVLVGPSVVPAMLGPMARTRPTTTVRSVLEASAAGVRDADNAAAHDVSIGTVRRWRREFTRQGRAVDGRQGADCPRCHDADLAAEPFAELFGWYLGDGHLTLGRRRVYALHIANDLAYPHCNDRIIELMRSVKPGARPHTRVREGCLVITASWLHWPCLLTQHGPGRKHMRRLHLTAWQEAIVHQHPAAFLRGLMHSDGCRTINRVRRTTAHGVRLHEYPRWQFKNASADILQWCTDSLDAVDVAWTRSGPRTVSVSRREAVARLDGLIGIKE